MSKADKYQKMPSAFVKLFNRYVKEYLHESRGEVERKADAIYRRFCVETPEIGGGENPMADNLYEFIAYMAYYEATDHRMGIDSIPVITEWMLKRAKPLGRIVNFNHKFGPALLNRWFHGIAKKTAKAKKSGKWGNTWDIIEVKKPEGVAYTLVGCPLLAFAKAHGYTDLLPYFCAIDHESAKLMHARLIREGTEALGASGCDYWYVGDQSKTAKKYAEHPKI